MASGNVYMGDFKNGKANGHGVYYYAKGGIYNGEWKEDLFDGKGIYIGNNTKYEARYSTDQDVICREVFTRERDMERAHS